MATESGNSQWLDKAAPVSDADMGASSGAPAETKRSLRKKAEMPPELDRMMQELSGHTSANEAAIAAGFERRLNILEATLADIVERSEISLRDRSAQLSVFEETLHALGAGLAEARNHHSDAASELRSGIAALAVRVNGLESKGLEAPQEALWPQPADIVSPESEPSPGSIESQAASTELPPFIAEPAVSQRASEGTSYLAAARRAAIASIPETGAKARAAAELPRWTKRAHLLVAACAAPLLVLGTAAFFLYRHPVTANTIPAPAASSKQANVAAEDRAPHTPPPSVDVAAPADPTAAEIASNSPVRELQEKAGQGDARAARDLGLKYLTGDGITANDDEAARWLLRAAYTGESEAEYWLGTLYARGRGVPEDESQALHWYEAAAKQGNGKAMHRLGILYFEGQGVTKNETEAARWFSQAAELGSIDSAFNLAVLYERGAGVKASPTDAYKWYAIAARTGDKESASRVEALAKQLKPAEIAAATKAAAEFHPKTKDVVSSE